jgi:hypothetical protein
MDAKGWTIFPGLNDKVYKNKSAKIKKGKINKI